MKKNLYILNQLHIVSWIGATPCWRRQKNYNIFPHFSRTFFFSTQLRNSYLYFRHTKHTIIHFYIRNIKYRRPIFIRPIFERLSICIFRGRPPKHIITYIQYKVRPFRISRHYIALPAFFFSVGHNSRGTSASLNFSKSEFKSFSESFPGQGCSDCVKKSSNVYLILIELILLILKDLYMFIECMWLHNMLNH